MKVKQIYTTLHLWLGLAVGLIFSIAAITGASMIFEEELDELMYPELHFCKTPLPGQERLPLDQLFVLAQQYAGKKKVERATFLEKEGYRNLIFKTEGDRMDALFLAVNPYTGNLEAMLAGRRHFFSVMEELHRQLFLGKIGKSITGVCCVSYLAVLLTGLLIWWPKNKKMLRQRLKIKWDAKAKRINWDIHAVGGFYTLPILFVVAFTGLIWSYTWVNDGIYYLFDGKGPKKPNTFFHLRPQEKSPVLLNNAYLQAMKLMPYKGEVNIRLPQKKQDVVEINKESYEASVPNVVDRLYFSAYTGALVQQEFYTKQSKGMKVRRLIYPIHTGSVGGWLTKIIYFVAILFASTLPFTGFFVWLGKKKKGKKHQRAVVISNEPATPSPVKHIPRLKQVYAKTDKP